MTKGFLYFVVTLILMPLAIAETSLTQAQAIELAQATVAKQKNLATDKFELVSAKTVQWPDSSLGCPQPGMMYAQVITSGYQVTLIATPAGNTHVVHIGAGRAVVCDKTARTSSQTEKNLRFGQRLQQSQQAQKLLAVRLSVARDEIRIVGARMLESKKADSPCKGEPANTHMQLIELSHQNQVYRYRVIDNRLVFCD